MPITVRRHPDTLSALRFLKRILLRVIRAGCDGTFGTPGEGTVVEDKTWIGLLIDMTVELAITLFACSTAAELNGGETVCKLPVLTVDEADGPERGWSGIESIHLSSGYATGKRILLDGMAFLDIHAGLQDHKACVEGEIDLQPCHVLALPLALSCLRPHIR